jgi:DNA mismatch endonuclease, patch repair protein
MAEYRPKSPDEIARNMAAIRSTENKTERALRQALHRLGLRYRKYVTHLPGKPDIVFTSAKTAIFIDGDYWHARLLREKGEAALVSSIKSVNRDYWIRKFRRNVEKDDEATAALLAAGWKVLRYWESDVKRDISGVAISIAQSVRAERSHHAARFRRGHSL